jgi:hypothetical protein
MAQITILEHIVYADGSTTPVSASVNHEGCTVLWHESSVSLTWDQMADVEHLSNVFEDATVRAFKVIVGMLGKIHAYKDMYVVLT